jgi:hypothetical protein
MKTAILVLLASSFLWAQTPAKFSASSTPVPQTAPATQPASPKPDALAELLAQVQAEAQRSDSDLARLRIDKWKTDATSKQQAQTSVASIRRNLANAVPELMQRIQSAPGSLTANFRLYRNFNALYDTFSALVESAGAFGPNDQYAPLADDLAQLDQIRHQFAERMDQLAGSGDAELIRLRTQAAAASTKPVPKVVVDDNSPTAKKKKSKSTPPPSQP